MTLTAGNEPRAAAFVNIDGNADIDLAVTNNDDRTVSLYTNTGVGFVASGTLTTGVQLRPEGIVAADLNGDGLEDLAVAANDNVIPDAAIVYLNSGGGFGAGFPYATGGIDTSGILAADLDCDGMLDLVTRNETSSNLSILQNLGGGVFGPAMFIPTGLNPDMTVAADLDGDGDQDLAVSNRDSNNVSVSINQTCGGEVALLLDAQVTVGTITSGDVIDLLFDDDSFLQTRSGFGSSFVDLHNMTMEVTASSAVQNPSTVTVSIASRISESNGSAQIFLADWTNGGAPASIGSYAISDIEERVTLNPQDASRFVGPNGEILLTIKHVVFVPFFAFQFDSFLDEVEIVVE